MAVVKTETIHFAGHGPWKMVVKVSPGGEFSIELPEWIIDTLRCPGKVTGHTLHGVETAFRDRRKEYLNANTTISKVIVYKVLDRAKIIRDDRVVLRADNIVFGHGVGVTLGAMVCNEHEITKPDGKVVYRYEHLESTLPKAANVALPFEEKAQFLLPWTEEREKFFLYVLTSLENLILQLNELTGDSDKLIDAIEAGHLIGTGTQSSTDKG